MYKDGCVKVMVCRVQLLKVNGWLYSLEAVRMETLYRRGVLYYMCKRAAVHVAILSCTLLFRRF